VSPPAARPTTPEAMLQWLRQEVAGFLEVDVEQVQLDTNFYDDLEADSIDLVEVITIIERELDLEIDDQHLYDIETVGELVEVILRIQAQQHPDDV
jgi:acyl carrier protein